MEVGGSGLGSRIIPEAGLAARWGHSLWPGTGWSLTHSWIPSAGLGLYSAERDPGARVQAPVEEVH